MDTSADPRLVTGTLAPRGHAHQEELVSAAQRDMGAVAAAVLGDRLRSLRAGRTKEGRQYFDLQDGVQGKPPRIWVDAVPLEAGRIADTATNTTSQNYVIRVSDRLPTELLGRVLAHELGELTAVRARAAQGRTPVREDFLREGAELPASQELSAADMGRIGELNWLAEQSGNPNLSTQQQTDAREKFSALLDPYGIRPTVAMSAEEAFQDQEIAADQRFWTSRDFLSRNSVRLLVDLARPIEQLSPADATALQASRDAALRAQRQVEAFIGRREVTMALPGYDQNGLPLPRDQLERSAEEWAAWREKVSDRTGQALADQLAGGETPLRKVVIGGGASLSGRDPEALLVDAAGRWHLDPGAGIVQSADQDRDLSHWMGADPYAAVGDPRDRVPIEAVRLWEDQLATQGDVVNGFARLQLGENGELRAEITAFGKDGEPEAKPLRVACDGVPSVATGLPPELVPGTVRGADGVESRSEAVRLLGDRLRELEGQGVAGAKDLRDRLVRAERSGADTRSVLDDLGESPLKDALRAGPDGEPAVRLQNCFAVLEATRKWEAAREEAPGRALMGDEVAENRFDAQDAQHWIIAGSGGTGVANAEIILRENLTARVTVIGRGELPAALEHQVQLGAMQRKYGPGGEGRLEFGNASVGEIETVRGEDGRTRFRMSYMVGEGDAKEERTVDADGYVASLGRTNPLPAAVQALADQVRDQQGEISGDLLFDRDDQYIGYGLNFTVDGREHRVDVDGAASWQLPREVFEPGLQTELNAMGLRALPSETGNAAPGFSPVARQSALRARAVAQAREGDLDAVRRLSSVPERWKPPKRTTAAERPTAAEQVQQPPERTTDTDRAPEPRLATEPGHTTEAGRTVEPGLTPEGERPAGTGATPPAQRTTGAEQAPTTERTEQAERQAPEAPGTTAPQHAPPAEHTAAERRTAAPGRGAPGSHLWQMGVNRNGRGPSGPTRPGPPPPETGPSGPGLGFGD